MIPDFALNLSFQGISLLRRAKGGWTKLGEVALDGDLDADMRNLRATAEAASPDGVCVKLVIPVDQIKYLDLDDPGEDEARRAAALAALDGATPYAIDDLSYDWSVRDGRLFVAALAQETLEEAESFALTHGFRPVMAVAMPRPRKFKGEPFFGALASWNGEPPTRDRPIKLLSDEVQRPPPPADPAPVNSKAAGAQEVAARSKGLRSAAVARGATGEKLSGPARADDARSADPARTAGVAKKGDPSRSLASETEAVEAASAPEAPRDPGPKDVPRPTFTSIRARRDDDGAGDAPKVTSPAGVDVLTRPVPPRPNAEEVRARLRSIAASDPAREDTAPVSPAARERPHGPGADTEKPVPRLARRDKPAVSIRKPAAPDAAATRRGGVAARIAALRPGREPAGPVAGAPAAGGASDEAERMSRFGARSTGHEVGGKPRFLGLMLTTALLLFLVGVAAWASFSIEDGLARIFRSAPEPVTQIAAVPAPSVDAPDETDPGARVAARGTEADTTTEGPETSASGPEATGATFAASGIWQSAPAAPAELRAGELDADDVYLLSLDAPVIEHDAIALPEASAQVSDAPYPAPMPPAPADVEFDLDARGLVRATDEGAINPDRVRVFAGLPPAVPPNRASVLPEGADEVQTVADVARIKALGGTRPRGRPVTLIEDNERIAFRGVTATELAAIRPALRPAPDKAAAEEDTAATERAVSVSLAPPPRPDNFGARVEEARRLSAQVAPRTVEPPAPSGSTVAERATIRNAVDLRKLNLIGVYGEPSSRRALVRLPNGRYQKVKVGDRVDGGRIAAIGEDQLRYVKAGRNMTLRMP